MSSQNGSVRCSALTKSGQPCRAWAVKGTTACAAHSREVGAPIGNKNRQTHGFYSSDGRKIETIDDVVADLLAKQEKLSGFIDGFNGDNVQDLLPVLSLLGQNASRIGRLLRDQKIVGGDSADKALLLLDQALDELDREFEADLGFSGAVGGVGK